MIIGVELPTWNRIMRPKKCIKLLVWVIVGLYLATQIYVQLRLDKVDLKNKFLQPKCENCSLTDNFKQIFNAKKQIETYSPCYKWTLNGQVYQYSSYFCVKNGQVTSVESVVVVKGRGIRDQLAMRKMHCVFKKISTGTYYKAAIVNVQYYSNQTKKISCSTSNLKYSEINDTALAILFIDDYDLSESDHVDLFKYGISRLPASFINFQIPRVIHVPDKRLPAVAHCVHYTYNIADQDIDKILNWLEIQKSFGYKKIVFYDANINDMLVDRVYAKFDIEFVEIRPYHIQYEAICDLRLLNMYEYTDILRHRVIRDMCEMAFYNYFENPTYSSSNRWRHQYINSNDCLLSLKETYEFVSYFDFDEIIYPRRMSLDNFARENEAALHCPELNGICNYENQQNIYDYLQNLISLRFPYPIDKLSYIYFTNGMFMPLNYYVKTFVNELVKISNQNEVIFSASTVLEKKIYFLLQHGHTFNITKDDNGYIRRFIGLFEKLECLYNRYNTEIDPLLDDTFKRFVFLATGRKHHMGKSVHYTPNVDSIFTHYATKTRDYTVSLEVEPVDGILSHFRSDFYYLARDLTSGIENFKIDFEYYNWLIAKKSLLCKPV
jgi:hypothetical protein